MQPTVLFRADGSREIGTGHVMRCLALAQAWQETGGAAYFASAKTTPALWERLAAEGVSCTLLSNIVPGSPEDAARTVDQARQIGAAWVVADGYGFDSDYQRRIREAGLRLFVLDDYGHTARYHADLVLNQNLGADASIYARRDPQTRLLLGTRYALLRREFQIQWDRQRPVAATARRVLVTLGGSDPDNVTLKVIEALRQIPGQDLEAEVIVGGSNPHFASLRAEAGRSPHRVRLLRNVTDLPERMARADIAVAAAGSTCWELAFLGVPSLVLALADNQRLPARGMEAEGAARSLGWHADLTAEDIAESLQRLRADAAARAEMARRGPSLVDGEGAGRVVAAMRDEALRLRRARAEDCRLLWEWANDPGVRAMSFTSEPIPWERHVRWFTARLRDPQCLLFIAVDAADRPVGQVRLDRSGAEAVVSLSLDPAVRGRGLGSQVVRAAARAFLACRDARRIHAFIKPENTPSLRAFAKAGFAETKTTTVEGHYASHLVLERGEPDAPDA